MWPWRVRMPTQNLAPKDVLARTKPTHPPFLLWFSAVECLSRTFVGHSQTRLLNRRTYVMFSGKLRRARAHLRSQVGQPCAPRSPQPCLPTLKKVRFFNEIMPTLLRTCRRLCCTLQESGQRKEKWSSAYEKLRRTIKNTLGKTAHCSTASQFGLCLIREIFCQHHWTRVVDMIRTELQMIFDKVCLYIILQASLLSLPPFLPTNLMARAGFLRAAGYHPCGTVFVCLDSTIPRSAHIAEKVQILSKCCKYSSNTGVASFHRHR